MLLAIDTSTRAASIALYDKRGVVGETTWHTRENHTRHLMPEVIRLLELCGRRVEEMTAVAAATGPGSFTGLRIGLSAAKGLALARGIPLIGIPTLDATAHAYSQYPGVIWAVLEAGRGRYGAAMYVPNKQSTKRASEYVFGRADEIVVQLRARLDEVPIIAESNGGGEKSKDHRVIVCGEVDESLQSQVLAALEGQVVIASGANSIRRAGLLAELAWLRRQLDVVDDVASLAPFYIPTAALPQLSHV